MPDTNPTPETTPDTDVETAAHAVDLEAFDFDAFVAGIARPFEVVPVCQDARTARRIHDAQQHIARLEQQEEDAKVEGRPTRRRAATVEAPELEDARAHLEELREQARSSYVYVRVEAVGSDARDQAVKDAKAAGGALLAYNLSVISQTARLHLRDPRADTDAPGKVLTVDQWNALREAVGALQWDAIIEASNRVAADSVTPDFSQPASLSPAGSTSSRS